ncbi:hypothetical protein SmJEL517_g05256 [Synchytrium microbalum]|uniref:Uncharacterized protein n=1 Tax=Synchytrium microbalum TaxID=1806994 RepID=A0A507BQ94_9FUNG|nr:uncharacterized protein SmJEL517_g05256 [Synchytrium microbalum]TPX31427.1 hypothetical protein SmJEL517_g05256 [Synchytrium microbalum]
MAAEGVGPTVEIPLLHGDEEALLVNLENDDFTGPGQDEYIVSILTNESVPLSLFLTFAVEAHKRNLTKAFHTFLNGGKKYFDEGKGASGPDTERDKIILLNALINDKIHAAYKQKNLALLDEVTRLINEADAIDARDALTRVSKAMLYYVKGEFEPAYTLLTGFSDVNDLPFNITMGAVAMKLKKWKEACKCYQRILMVAPDLKPDPRIPIGVCFYRTGHLELARKSFERALELNPSDVTAILSLAAMDWKEAKNANRTLDDRTEMKKAGKKRIETAARVDAQHPLVQIFLSLREMEKPVEVQNVAKWIGWADKVLENTQSSSLRSDAYFLKARALHCQEQYSQAFESYKAALESNPDSVPILRGLGEMYIWLGDETRAIETFEKVLEKSPNATAVLYALGSLYAKRHEEKAKQKVTELFTTLAKAITGPNGEELVRNPMLCVEMAWVKEGTDGSNKECEEWYTKAVNIMTDEHMEVPIEVANNLAVKMHLNGKQEDLKHMFEIALEKCRAMDDSTDDKIVAYEITIRYNLARHLEQISDIEQAVALYEEILQSDPEYHDARLRLGAIAESQEQYEKAREHFNKVLAFDSRHVDAIVMLAHHWENLSNSHSSKSGKISDEAHKETKAARDLYQKLGKDNIDRTDPYGLCGAGNATLSFARADYKNRPGHLKTAFEYFNKALKHEKTCIYAIVGIANLFAESEHYKDASDVYQQVLDTAGVPPAVIVTATLNHAHVLYNLGLHKQAIAKYESVLHSTYKDHNAELSNFIARCCFAIAKQTHDPQMMLAALEHIRKATKLDPNNNSYRYNIAMVQQQYAHTLNSAPSHKRTVAAMEEALQGLELSRSTFSALAQIDPAQHDGSYDIKAALQRADFCEKVKRETEKKMHETKTLDRERTLKMQMLEEERAKKREEALLEQEAKRAAEQKRKEEVEANLLRLNEIARQQNQAQKDEEEAARERKAQRKAAKGKPKKGDGIVEDNDSSDPDASDAGNQEPAPKRKSVVKKKRKVKEVTPESDAEESDQADNAANDDVETNDAGSDANNKPADGATDDDERPKKKSKKSKSSKSSKSSSKSKSKPSKSSKKRRRNVSDDEDESRNSKSAAASEQEGSDDGESKPRKKSKSAAKNKSRKALILSAEFVDSDEEGGAVNENDGGEEGATGDVVEGEE